MRVVQEPTGPFQVGSIIYEIKDDERKEIFSEDSSAKRKFVVELFYPAQKTEESACVPYAQDIMAEWKDGLEKASCKEAEIKELTTQMTYALRAAPVASTKKPYPIVLFSHAFVGLRSSYTNYYEELASQGYVVTAISHTYFCKFTKFPDGSSIPVHMSNMGRYTLEREDDSQELQEIWIDDAKATLDFLQKLNETESTNNFFYGAFDMTKCGMAGHSFGGSTAFQMARNDARIKAAINIDGALYGKHASVPIDKPLLAIVCKDAFDECYFQALENGKNAQIGPHPTLDDRYCKFLPTLINTSENVELIALESARHMAFTDWAMLKNLPLYKNNPHLVNMDDVTGNIQGVQFMRKTKKYLTDFFAKHLKDIDPAIQESSQTANIEMQPK